MTERATRISRRLGRGLLAVAVGAGIGAIATRGGPKSRRSQQATPALARRAAAPRRPGQTSGPSPPTSAADSSATESWPAAPPATAGSVDLRDPEAVAGAVASGLFQSGGPGLPVPVPVSVLSTHARRVHDAFIARSTRPSTAAAASIAILDPRTVPVVVQVDVVRWWDEPTTALPDSSPHLVRLTMLIQPGGRWSVDDIQILS